MGDEKEFLRWCVDGALLQVRLRPASTRRALLGVQGGRLVIAVHAPPERGKANREALELLSRALRVPPSRMEIVSGRSTRNKTVLVRGLVENDLPRVALLLSGDRV